MYDELTEVDIRKMREEIDYRTRVLRPKLIEDVQTALAFGDLSENFEYKCAKQEKNRNDSRIRYLERMIRTGSDRFYITAEDTDGCFCLYYHPSDKPDSQIMHPRFFLHSFTYFSLLCFRFNSCCEPTIPRQSKYYLKKSIRIR